MNYREIEIYDKILELRKGNEKQKEIAFKCEVLLADEYSKYSLEEKLKKIEDIINAM